MRTQAASSRWCRRRPTTHSGTSDGLTQAQNAYLNNANIGAANNRATQLAYAPGSTFKPITGLAAVKEGFASLSGSYDCVGTYKQPGDTSGAQFDNWTTADLGYMSIATALKVSCDTVFDAFGSQFYYTYANNPLGANADPLQGDLRQWGFEEPTGIDLPSEATGLIPDPAWASSAKDSYGKPLFPYGWVPGGDILTMIGSGNVQVTPLQLARAYAAIANGGHLCTPHLVDQIIDGTGWVGREEGRRGLRSDRAVHGRPAELHPWRPPQRGARRHRDVRVRGIPVLAGRRGRQDGDRRAGERRTPRGSPRWLVRTRTSPIM